MTSFPSFVMSTLADVYLGFFVGLTVGQSIIDPDKHWIDVLGIILVRLIQLITAPLIFSSIVTRIFSPSAGTSKDMTLPAVVFLIFTSHISISIGLILILLIEPGLLLFDDKIEADVDTVYSHLFNLLRKLFVNVFGVSTENLETQDGEQETGSVPAEADGPVAVQL